jgi:hypothetical protein
LILNYKSIKNRPKIFRTLTGLDSAEFNDLLPLFTEAWNEYIQDTFIKGKKRIRAYGGGNSPKLSTMEDRLLFILFYFKTYPLQEVIAFLFGLSQSQANFWIHRLSDVMKRALGKGAYLPERIADKTADALKDCPGLSFVIDGTDRRIRRPKDSEKQEEFYSGRRKCHTVKNNIIADAVTGKAVYLSRTCEGKKHDKKICDEENHKFPEGSSLYKDTGFQGYEPENTVCYQPKKKPRGKKLPLEDRLFNALISGVRVIVEHAVSGIKRLRIVSDVFRNTKEGYDDLVMEVACGLHNLRIDFRPLRQSKKDSEAVWH